METITTKLRHLAERLALPLLCIATLPVAFLAGLATVLAWTLLLTRVALVYIEVLVTLIPDYLIRLHSPPPPPDPPLSPAPPHNPVKVKEF
ncbi:hypothetical protein N0V88_003160 [Collariella sp. IMI 366227]|nr:hypothetical protein N0V88_003160 [Collariella sp. IMI 366227]